MADYSNILNGVSKEMFISSMNKLLNSCFILKDNKDTISDYNFILQNEEKCSAYLELLGYELIVNTEYGVITVRNTQGMGRIRFSKRESIILLILRLIYIERKKELSQIDAVIVTLEAIYDKWAMLKMDVKLSKDVLVSCLRKYKSMNLITNLDRLDLNEADSRIIIYPSILFAITSESLDEMYNFAQQKLFEYTNGGDNNANDDSENEETNED